MEGGIVWKQRRKGVAKVIVYLGGFILKGIFGYKITKVWQWKKEEGRGKDTNQCLQFEGVATTGWFLLDIFWLKCRTFLGTCRIQGEELCTMRLSGKMKIICYKWLMNFALSGLLVHQGLFFFSFLIGLKYLEVRKARVRKRLGRLLEKEFKGREDNNHFSVIIITFHMRFCSLINLPNNLRKDCSHVFTF